MDNLTCQICGDELKMTSSGKTVCSFCGAVFNFKEETDKTTKKNDEPSTNNKEPIDPILDYAKKAYMSRLISVLKYIIKIKKLSQDWFVK